MEKDLTSDNHQQVSLVNKILAKIEESITIEIIADSNIKPSLKRKKKNRLNIDSNMLFVKGFEKLHKLKLEHNIRGLRKDSRNIWR